SGKLLVFKTSIPVSICGYRTPWSNEFLRTRNPSAALPSTLAFLSLQVESRTGGRIRTAMSLGTPCRQQRLAKRATAQRFKACRIFPFCAEVCRVDSITLGPAVNFDPEGT